MVNRILFIIMMSGHNITYAGNENNNVVTPTDNGKAEEITTTIATSMQSGDSTPQETQEQPQRPQSISQLTKVKAMIESIREKERALLIKSAAICLTGGITIFAIARLK